MWVRFRGDDEHRLYERGWQLSVASGMDPSTLKAMSVDFAAGSEHSFRARGTTVVDPGFLAVYEEGKDSKGKDDDDEGRKLPAMTTGDSVPPARPHADQHFTQPQPRLPGASLLQTRESPAGCREGKERGSRGRSRGRT